MVQLIGAQKAPYNPLPINFCTLTQELMFPTITVPMPQCFEQYEAFCLPVSRTPQIFLCFRIRVVLRIASFDLVFTTYYRRLKRLVNVIEWILIKKSHRTLRCLLCSIERFYMCHLKLGCHANNAKIHFPIIISGSPGWFPVGASATRDADKYSNAVITAKFFSSIAQNWSCPQRPAPWTYQ